MTLEYDKRDYYKMKPTLEDILQATLDWHHTDRRFWDNHNSSRSTTIVAMKRDFCILASHAGFPNSEIGKFLHMRENTIIKLAQEVNKEYAEYMIQELSPKLVQIWCKHNFTTI